MSDAQRPAEELCKCPEDDCACETGLGAAFTYKGGCRKRERFLADNPGVCCPRALETGGQRHTLNCGREPT